MIMFIKEKLLTIIQNGNNKTNRIKNRTYNVYNDMIDIKKCDSDLLKIDKKSNKNIGIYNIGYIKI